MLRLVQGGAESLLALVNDILDLSKIEAGKLRLERAEFELRRLVEETLELLRPRAREKGLALTTELGFGPELWLLGDSGRVRQVLTNLVGNAVKFTERGEVAVQVTLARETETQVALRLSVRDTGVGIPRETQALLFQPFVQAGGNQPGASTAGAGLGLAISRQLAELMGGEIGFESELGRGSAFWLDVELPRALGNGGSSRQKATQVLLVEDNEDDRVLLQHELAGGEITVEGLADAAAALAWLRAKSAAGEPLPFVLIDWHLGGGMSGLQLATAIRGDAALGEARLALMSGGPLANPAIATAAGFEEFLLKPVQRDAVERLLARPADPRRAMPATPPALPIRTLRVLLAEDNLANQLVARMILAKIGCEVDVVGDGAAALERLAKGAYDVVLMDCQMPVLDGYEATRRLRAGAVPGANANVPIIAVTAYAMREDRAKCLAAGMNDYVTKPVRPAELQAALERCGMRVAGLETVPREPPPAVGDVLDTRTIERLRGMTGEMGPSLLPELIAQFLSEEPAAMADLQALTKQRDGKALAERAHALGGNAAVLGGLLVRNAALALERSARSGDAAEWPGRLGTLRSELARMRAALAEISTSL